MAGIFAPLPSVRSGAVLAGTGAELSLFTPVGGDGIDVAYDGAGKLLTLTFDATELNDLTWGDGTFPRIEWIFNTSVVGPDVILSFGSGVFGVTGFFYPDVTETYDLGKGTFAWRDAYLSRQLHLLASTNQIVLGSNDDFSGTISMAALSGSNKTWTFPNVTGTVALLEAPNVFTANQTISNTAPSLVLTDTTASAKSLTIAVDANVVNLRESAGAASSLMVFDLANNRVAIGAAPVGQIFEISAAIPYLSIIHTNTANYGGLLFYENAALLGVIQQIGSTFATTERKSDIEIQNFTTGNIGKITFWTNSTLALTLDALRNLGLNTQTFGTNASGVIGLLNAAVVPASSPANMIQIYAKDSSVGSANSTLAIRTEQAVAAIGTFTPSHKWRIWLNEVEFDIQLDAV